MKELTIDTSAMAWEVADGYPEGAMQRVLDEGSDSSPRSILLRIEPGWAMTEHSHVFTELHYVLEGEYESDGEVHQAGTFRLIPRHTNHGPFSTSTGAVILIVWIKD